MWAATLLALSAVLQSDIELKNITLKFLEKCEITRDSNDVKINKLTKVLYVILYVLIIVY